MGFLSSSFSNLQWETKVPSKCYVFQSKSIIPFVYFKSTFSDVPVSVFLILGHLLLKSSGWLKAFLSTIVINLSIFPTYVFCLLFSSEVSINWSGTIAIMFAV